MEFVSYSCQTIFLFMTDGVITKGMDDKDDLVNKISKMNQNIGATIFTYSFGADADKDITNAISCANNGIWTEVGNDVILLFTIKFIYNNKS